MILSAALVLAGLPADASTTPSPVATATIQNSDAIGQVSRFDVAGNALDAHDGSILRVGNVFYLYGTSYACGYRYQQNSSFCGFKVYSSPDLAHWTDRGYVLAPGACGFCFRPHVVFNATTQRYVMWADGGGHYIVATSSTPTGLFTRQPDPTLAVGGAVDESLFVDGDGTGYVIHNTVLVDAGLTADMVVEKLTPDYLNTSGESARLGLGDVEAFTVFKRAGVYHALMSDPSCAYCSGGTGEMTATSMLGPWSGSWFDPNGTHQSGRAEPRWRARLVNADSCGGQPLASFPIVSASGSTTYYFVSDRWNNRAPNESLANFFIGPMKFDQAGTLQAIECTNSFQLSVPGPAGTYLRPPDLDQNSGFEGFHHYCDIAGNVQRQQQFIPARDGSLSSASVTTFQAGTPNAPLTLEVVDAATNQVVSHDDFPVATVPWAPTTLVSRPGLAVTAGHTYLLRLHSATTSGCYGWEYNDSNPYPSGYESYSVDSGGAFTAEPARDLKFTTSVSTTAAFTPNGLPAGFTLCAPEAGTCAFTGTRMVAYGVGNSANSYLLRTATSEIDCGIVSFGSDPDVGVLKSCYVAPLRGPVGSTPCAAEGGTCIVPTPSLVTYGQNGAFTHRMVTTGRATCTNAAFGSDPISGTTKGCYLAPAGGPSGWTSCAAEGGTCTGTAPRTVIFGARGAFYSRWVTASVSCTAAAFGADPIPRQPKACYISST